MDFINAECKHIYDCDDYYENPDNCPCNIFEHTKHGTQLCDAKDFALSSGYYLAYFDRHKKLTCCVWQTSKILPHIVGME